MYQQAISYEDFQNICRFCLSKGSAENNLNSLYDEKNVSLSKTLSLMVQACLSIQVFNFNSVNFYFVKQN